MKYYSKNIFRSVLQNRGSYIGAVIIISIGIMVYIAMMEFLNNLSRTADEYYQRNAFADVFAEVESMPRGKLDSLLDIEGIDAVFGRLEGDARMVSGDSGEIVTMHLMAWSAEDSMNLLTLRPSPTDMADDEIYVGANMAAAHGFQPGDTITLVANSRTRRFSYSGRSHTPEAMYMLADESVSAPDNAIYDMAVVSRPGLESLLGKRGIVTHIGVRLSPGCQYVQVKNALEQRLQPYGLNSLCPRKDQISYDTLDEEIASYSLIIALLPTIFMLVTMFILYVVLKKMVDKDRTLIGTLKAFGASNWEIISRYLLLGAGIGLAGGLLPILPGELAGQYLYLDDIDFYAIPYQDYQVDPTVWVKGMLIAAGTALTALMIGIRDVLYIMPAESMRSAPPSSGATFTLPPWLDRLLNRRQKIGLRAIFRNLLRSVIIALSIAMPFSMISAFGSFNDVLNQTIFDQFLKAETYDLRIRLTDYVSESDASNIVRKLDGVHMWESFGSYPVDLVARNRTESASLTVLNKGSHMNRIMDIYNQFFEPRDDGLILSEGFANKLNVQVGDIIEVSGNHLTRNGQTVRVPVVQIIRVGFGSGCYLSREGIEHFFRTPYRANSILLLAEEGQLPQIKTQLNKLRGVSFGVESTRMMYYSVDMMDTTVIMLNLMAVFSLIAGVIMIYNIINISMRERRNEFGTLMVLGMRTNEITEIILFEQILNFIVGILLGFPFSRLLCNLTEYAVATDTLSVEMHIRPVMYLGTFAICTAATAISLFFVIREVLHIQLTDVLKARE